MISLAFRPLKFGFSLTILWSWARYDNLLFSRPKRVYAAYYSLPGLLEYSRNLKELQTARTQQDLYLENIS